ncbi:MAG: ribonuclease III [Gammaproteobacteria bacterium]|nr:ribonuclease III [Gammaproteobacteria bacterium]MCH9743550.1 ribonuclease III [Gammaproteobacteria bacterium]
MQNLEPLEAVIAYQFQDKQLLQLALTHRSVRGPHNERLEFLGDAVVNFLIADTLYQRYPDLREGNLSRLRAGLVSGERMAELARSLQLGRYLYLGVGEQKNGGCERESILADSAEALIGAIYLDSDMDACREIVLGWFTKYFENLSNLKPYKDPKSSLQEWLQGRQLPLPQYISRATGEAHQQMFHVTCRVQGLSHETTGESSSRRKAEQIAAEAYLEIVENKDV